MLVLASLWEGMPNVVLEAMAARRAVVATAVEGTEELVLPRQTGWLVPPRDPDSLAQALLEAARTPPFASSWVEKDATAPCGRFRSNRSWRPTSGSGQGFWVTDPA